MSMKSLWTEFKQYLKKIAQVLEKWRWLFLFFISISLLWEETAEVLGFTTFVEQQRIFHYFEILQYLIVLTFTGLLLELNSRLNRAHNKALAILEYKHRISLEFISTDDWETLIRKLVELPGRIASETDETYLLAINTKSEEFEVIEHWISDCQSPPSEEWDPFILCAKCLNAIESNTPAFHICNSNGEETPSRRIYSLGISHQDLPGALLRFRLKAGSVLSRYEERIFDNIGDEIIVALETSQARMRLSEMQSAEVAMAERRQVSTYVHDQLGQNLGYLHFKLDQLGASEDVIDSKELRNELKNLQEVANESYEIVRDILKKMQPETVSNLTNLMKEHAVTVSRRARFSLNFKVVGTAVHLEPKTQQMFFFVFREILGNVEKHAQASKVDVLVVWHDDCLDVSVSDNGKGFDPRLVQSNEHFGIGIMQERMVNIKGKMILNSSPDLGTVISISLPFNDKKLEVS